MSVRYYEINYLEPICYATVLHQAYPENFLFLDSNADNRNFGEEGRYSYICFNPKSVIHISNTQCFHDGQKINENPFLYLKSYLASLPQYDSVSLLPPFQCGLAGYFGYEMLHYLEEIPSVTNAFKPNHTIDDMRFCYYDFLLSFDHAQKKAWFVAGEDSHFEEEKNKFNPLLNLAKEISDHQNDKTIIDAPLKVLYNDFDQSTYESIIQKTIDYIYAGDIFQANITRRFYAKLENINVFDLYSRLRVINPAPFSCFFHWNTESKFSSALLSSSPERFISVTDQGLVQTRPIKGTRKRCSDKEQDIMVQNELLTSAKDRAENMMIVDLMRNDLSRVCKPFTVKTPHLCQLETYETLHHLVSVVEGELQEGKNCLDLLMATFPGGSITGAPKVRAMEIISELEACPRGAYCGSAGFIGLNGTMDTSIMIRTLVFDQNIIAFNAGGGIVADSSPREEFEETIIKANALYNALAGLGRSD